MSKPVLYYALFSPPARACMLTAKVIGLDLDLRFVDFSKKEHLSEEFMKINPQHQIPVFIDADGEVYIDSHAICSFMVSKYASNDKLYPKDLKQRAHVDHLLYYENGELFHVIKDIVGRNLYGGEGDLNKKSLDLCHNAYGNLENFLQNSNFVAGSEMTIADISINTTMVTLDLLIPVKKEKYPKICEWFERMNALLPDYEEVNLKGARALHTRIITVMAQNKDKSS